MKIYDDISKISEGNAALKNILERTSVRRYKAGKVPDEIVSALLHAAMSAPTGVNRQPWEFVIVDDPDKLRQLADALPYAKMAAEASLAIIVCGNTKRFLEGYDSTLWVQDLAAASENILLAADALGLGGVYTCLYPHPDREGAVSRILGIPDGIISFNLIPIGYPDRHHDPIDKWHRDRIHINGYE